MLRGLRRAWRHATGFKPAALFLAVLVLVALIAPWLAPFDPAEQIDPASSANRAPGTSLIEVRIGTAGGTTRPYLADRVSGDAASGWHLERRAGRGVLGPSGDAAIQAVGERRTYWLGTDKYGRDLLSRLLYGSRVSLAVGLIAGLLAAVLGTAVGATAALGNRWVDALLMRTVDGLLAFPRLILVLALAALWGTGVWQIVLIVATTGWMATGRIVRADARALLDSDFVRAARIAGQSPAGVFVRHLLPNIAAPLLVTTVLRIADTVLLEAALSFFGLGLQPPAASWGSIIEDGRGVLTSAWWVSGFAGLAIVLLVLSLAVIADGLQDALAGSEG